MMLLPGRLVSSKLVLHKIYITKEVSGLTASYAYGERDSESLYKKKLWYCCTIFDSTPQPHCRLSVVHQEWMIGQVCYFCKVRNKKGRFILFGGATHFVFWGKSSGIFHCKYVNTVRYCEHRHNGHKGWDAKGINAPVAKADSYLTSSLLTAAFEKNFVMSNDTKEIASAAFRGLMCWVLLYAVLMHLLVAWHWDSGTPYGHIQQRDLDEGETTVLDDNTQTEQTEVEHSTSKYIDALNSVIESYRLAEEQHVSYLSQLAEHRSIIQGVSASTQPIRPELLLEWSRTQIDNIRDRFNDVEMLLSSPTLLSFSYEPEGTFSKAIDSLQEFASDENTSLNWEHHIHELLSASYPREPSVSTVTCPIDASDNDGEEDAVSVEVDPNAAKNSDLQKRVQRLKIMLDRRTPGTSLTASLLPDSVMQLEKDLQNEINENLIPQIIKKKSRMASSMGCAEPSHVLDMVEVGLDALYNKEDLRSALLQEISQIDPEGAEGIILDAVLPLSQPKIAQPETINLRQALDSELVSQSANWVDYIVEALGGYNDKFDHYLDSLAASDQSVGEILLGKFMALAGRVNLPHPRQVARGIMSPKELLNRLLH